MPRTVDAPAVPAPVASRPTRTMLFCAVKVPAPSSMPLTSDDAPAEVAVRLCTRFRAMTLVPPVDPLKEVPATDAVAEAAVQASEWTVFWDKVCPATVANWRMPYTFCAEALTELVQERLRTVLPVTVFTPVD